MPTYYHTIEEDNITAYVRCDYTIDQRGKLDEVDEIEIVELTIFQDGYELLVLTPEDIKYLGQKNNNLIDEMIERLLPEDKLQDMIKDYILDRGV